MSHQVIFAGAVVAGVQVTATAMLWLDRQGAKAVLRTGTVALAAALVTLALARGAEGLLAGVGEFWA
ncbi:MAG: hypothetical protein HRF46_10365, partial [Acidobacteriota bacterium]